MEGRYQFSLADLLLGVTAAPIWLFAIATLGSSHGWGQPSAGNYIFVGLVLLAMTAVIRQLTRRWIMAAIAAPVIAWIAILIVAWFLSGD